MTTTDPHNAKRLRAPTALLLAGVLLAAMGGCTANVPPYVTDQRLEQGLIVILPGIEGPSANNANIRQGLMDAALPYAMEIRNWHGWRAGASYAFDQPACRRQATELAERIAAYRAAHPGRPVFVVGHSAGGAIAVFLAEAMPPDQPLDGVITLAPALSPHYDLTAAIEGSSGNLLNCFTRTDLLLKGLTTAGRNLDGASGATAGHEGFSLPEGAPPRRREAVGYLEQIEWDTSMVKSGNLGGHLGWANAGWVGEYLAPDIRRWASRREGAASAGDEP